MMLNVMDYVDAAAAFAAARGGDSLYFPGGETYTAPSGGWQVGKSIEVFGDGLGTGGGTVLKAFNASSPVMTIVPPVENVYVHDIQFQASTGASSGTSSAIVCRSTAQNPNIARDVRLARLLVAGFPGDGIVFEGYNDSTARMLRVSCEDSEVRDCGGIGMKFVNAFDVSVAGGLFRANKKNGVAADGGSIGLLATIFDGNATLASWGPVSNPTEANLRLSECFMADVDACRFMNVQAGNVKRACVFSGSMGAVGSCYFDSTDGTQECAGIVLLTGSVAILSNRYKNIKTMISGNSLTRDCVILPQYEDSSVGSIVLAANMEGMWGAPNIVRDGGTVVAGMLVPGGVNDPAVVREGMLSYKSGVGLRLRSGGQWRTLLVE